MRPTLYADDIPDNLEVVGNVVAALNGAIALRNVKRILPHRCPGCRGLPHGLLDDEMAHKQCKGLGWLPPDPPADGKIRFYPDGRDKFLMRLWDEMGILEED